MAEEHDALPAIAQIGEVLRDGSHRYQGRSFDVADGVLSRFPNINQPERHAFREKRADFGRGYLNWQLIHRWQV